jgi:hypothetical protein
MVISLDKLRGWWKLSEAWHEFDSGPRMYPYQRGHGSLVFTEDGRMMSVIIAEQGIAHPPEYDMEAYSGSFILDGSEIVTTVDVSSRQDWRGRDLRQSLSVSPDGSRLFATAPKQTSSLYFGTPFTPVFNWYRIPR